MTCSSAWSRGIRSIGSTNCCPGIGSRQKQSRSEACAAAGRLRSVAFAAPSLGHGCNILRTAAIDVHTIIAGRDPMRLAQIDAQLVPWRSIDAHSKGEMTAIALPVDVLWERCWFGFWIAAGSTGTMRLTSRARVLRMQSQTQEENHSEAVGSRNRCQAIRCLHPSAYRN